MLKTTGRVLHKAAFYDLTMWLFTGSREAAFRKSIVRLAELAPGEAVLDVGCGTGSQAIAAKRRVGIAGSVTALDASPEMLDRARAKARKARVAIDVVQGIAEALPFDNQGFDVVLSTVMMHHLPKKAREQCVREMRRVLKPGGRLLVVDFEGTADQSKGFAAKLHRHKHGHVTNESLARMLESADLVVEKNGAVGVGDMHFTLARAPSQ